MKKIMLVLFATALTILVANTASAITIDPVQGVPTFEAYPDSHPNGFIGIPFDLFTGNLYGGDTRTYLQFDLSQFSKIDSATLWMTTYIIGAQDDVSVYGTSNNWALPLPTWNDQPALGLFGSTTTVGGGGSAWDVTSLAQSSAGGLFSLALVSADQSTWFIEYFGGNWPPSYVGVSPRLDVTPGSVIPEPASLSLLGLGLSGLLFRRRKRIV